jgi:hypothetical protein
VGNNKDKDAEERVSSLGLGRQSHLQPRFMSKSFETNTVSHSQPSVISEALLSGHNELSQGSLFTMNKLHLKIIITDRDLLLFAGFSGEA